MDLSKKCLFFPRCGLVSLTSLNLGGNTSWERGGEEAKSRDAVSCVLVWKEVGHPHFSTEGAASQRVNLTPLPSDLRPPPSALPGSQFPQSVPLGT